MPFCLLSAFAGVTKDVEFPMDSRAAPAALEEILCLGILLSFHRKVLCVCHAYVDFHILI